MLENLFMSKSKKKKKSVKPTPKFVEWWRSPRGRHLRGAIYIFFSLFAFVALLSYYFSGGDHDGNLLGLLGYKLSNFFAQNLFGIASVGLLLLLFVYGLRLFDKHILPWHKTLWVVLFWMLWLSTTLGYIASVCVSNEFFGNYAGIGVIFAEALNSLIRWGTLVLLAFLAGIFLVYVHKMKVKIPDITLPKFEKRPVTDVESDNPPHPSSETKKNPAEHHTDNDLGQNPASGQETGSEADIDDEFERVMRRAQKDAEKENASPATELEDLNVLDNLDKLGTIDAPVSDKPGESQEVLFTINDTLPDPDVEPAAKDDSDAPAPENESFVHFGLDELYDPHLDLKDFQLPSTDMLEDWERRNVKVSTDELVSNKDRIVSTLRDYGIEIVEIAASPGPTVTLYEIKPAPGIRISKIKSLEDDIALSLSASGIRIIAPIPGKGTVGIEVPNAKPQIVSMKTMLESDPFLNNSKMELPIALGKTISNEPYVTDLAKMPHLLMAGATGTGKSVGLNAVISSLLFKKHPSELKFVMVDPKKVELSLYSKIERHYLAKLPDSDEAIITDVKKVVRTLNSLCIEMDQRYDLLKSAQVRKITEYNDKFVHRQLNPEHGHHYMPYIVLVIDEFADLIMTAGKEVEAPICRLAQLARAVGIHLIIATQRPTTNIITGTIKANFPARIAFKVTSGIDSRTILDASGAQRLIGRGDMLISLSGSDMIRLQCALIETEEIDKLADFIGQQRGYPDGFLLPEYLDENEEPNKEFDPKQKDEFFNDAARLVVASQFGSTSLLQRKLQLGYNRAGRIIDQLEAAGIVGPYNGSKPREVLVHDDIALDEILRSL